MLLIYTFWGKEISFYFRRKEKEIEEEEEAYERRKLEKKLREKEAAYQEVGFRISSGYE